LKKQNVKPVNPGPKFSDDKVKLGKNLFWDKILSGNKDISCAGCHHPAQGTSDGLPLSIGTKAEGERFQRSVGEDRQFIPRNAQDIWNRGSPRWRTLFHDMRVRTVKNTGIQLTPAGFELPDEIENLQAAQAMIPVTSRDEMRGERGDVRVDGKPNEIARIPEGQFEEIWAAYFDRIRSIDGYRRLFSAAYPDTSTEKLSFAHAANAIAAYQIEAFTLLNSPWDRYLEGDTDALTKQQKRGARLFYGKGNCSSCHAGPLMTDQEAHNIGVPQLGPGKEPDEPYDLGFYSETGKPEDRFAFRTPPLRNVTVTGPWMHNGAYATLRGAVMHHLNPKQSLREYRANQLARDLRRMFSGPMDMEELAGLTRRDGRNLAETVRSSRQDIELVLRNLDPQLEFIDLNEEEVDSILAFLRSLTSPDVRVEEGKLSERLRRTIPDTVPSGLPVAKKNPF
jgi:cytochrome c peroxidase